ncbi:acyltransferase family protein [Leifsonia shinshuensis]|uniref:Peptidoglycan/LPS O-acetylase OafA/YrhL n=1 Tax=Leifsonia shinshuensis TaxID=150026 RepID=A0A853CUC1_9MICO|nr:acyltransferase family protein [Leifsonia shinshuensis]NYJ24002.1 peptidoglycan/LPS O-acetylase OafA/YrhL [Leifsonia shinshuensis]
MTSDTQPFTRAESRGRRSTTTTNRPATPPTVKRLDLQGLRALAVGLVILNHAFEWPAGGFIGVDIFFVISGFLMTSLLYREYERSGTIRFLAFYRRRIRRLIPASATVIAVTIAGAFALFGPGRFLSTVWDGVAALFFVSNWRFAAVSTDYFAQGAQTSPLQHYWSLSLEEQYYLVWPVAVLVLALLAAGRHRPRVLAAALCLVITAGLFVVSLQLTLTDSATAYFITPARLWELSVGSTVALCMPLFDRLPAVWRPFLMLASLAGMVVASVITPSGAGFPAPWALVAVVSAAVFIAFPWQPQRTWLNPLANPVFTHVGDISYSLYLWHFPALILITEAFRGLPGEKTALPAVVSIVVAFGLSEVTYRFVEETVRKSAWLEPKKTRRRPARGSKAKAIALGSLATATSALLLLAFTTDDRTPSLEGAAGKKTPPAGNALESQGDRTSLDALSSAITTALSEKSWPELDPSMDRVVAQYQFEPETHACASPSYPGVERCTWGAADAAHSMAIVGDSMSVAYVAMLRTIAEGSEGRLRFTALGQYSCPFIDLRTNSLNPEFADACPARKELAVESLASVRPDVLFVANGVVPYVDLDSGKEITASEYQQALQRSVERVAGEVGRVVVLAPPPPGDDIRECYSPRTSPAGCVSTVSARWKTFASSGARAVEGVGGVHIDTRPLFCVSNRCPAFADGIPVKFDATHLTEAYSRHIAPAFVALLAEAGVTLDGDGVPAATS